MQETHDPFSPLDTFARRHIGPSPEEIEQMLALLGFPSLDALVDDAIPAEIRLREPLKLPAPRGEHELLAELKAIMSKNKVYRSYIGMGYHDCIMPPVIQRNILENPGWYTAYTPYQAEISQGRLEALLNFQTMVMDLTGMEIANASLLDEATAAAEAMTMCHGLQHGEGRNVFFVSEDCHPQTIDVVKTRATPQGNSHCRWRSSQVPVRRECLRLLAAVSHDRRRDSRLRTIHSASARTQGAGGRRG